MSSDNTGAMSGNGLQVSAQPLQMTDDITSTMSSVDLQAASFDFVFFLFSCQIFLVNLFLLVSAQLLQMTDDTTCAMSIVDLQATSFNFVFFFDFLAKSFWSPCFLYNVNNT